MVSTDILKQFPVFCDLGEEVLGKIARACSMHTYDAGEEIVAQFQPAEKLYLILNGSIAIERRLPATSLGHKTGIVRNLKDNEVFGWSSLVEPRIHTISAVCIENSLTIEIDGKKLLKIMEKNREEGYLLMKALASIIASRLGDTTSHLMSQMVETERARGTSLWLGRTEDET
jgi:signal-transduction protein with cAMP-binding, CBS, and nucleotidyltransferase domain